MCGLWLRALIEICFHACCLKLHERQQTGSVCRQNVVSRHDELQVKDTLQCVERSALSLMDNYCEKL